MLSERGRQSSKGRHSPKKRSPNSSRSWHESPRSENYDEMYAAESPRPLGNGRNISPRQQDLTRKHESKKPWDYMVRLMCEIQRELDEVRNDQKNCLESMDMLRRNTTEIRAESRAQTEFLESYVKQDMADLKSAYVHCFADIAARLKADSKSFKRLEGVVNCKIDWLRQEIQKDLGGAKSDLAEIMSSTWVDGDELPRPGFPLEFRENSAPEASKNKFREAQPVSLGLQGELTELSWKLAAISKSFAQENWRQDGARASPNERDVLSQKPTVSIPPKSEAQQSTPPPRLLVSAEGANFLVSESSAHSVAFSEAEVEFYQPEAGIDEEAESPLSPTSFPRSTSPGTMTSIDSTSSKTTTGTKASFSNKTEMQDLEELAELFEIAEYAHERSVRPWKEKVISMGKTNVEIALDTLSCFVISLNAMYIGATIDAGPDRQRFVLFISTVFSGIFIVELFVRFAMNGIREHLTGSQKYLNIFEIAIILLDMALLYFTWSGALSGDTPSASLLRMARLVRLLRLLRILTNPLFETPLMMFQGFIAGIGTLFWAFLIFVVMVYLSSLVFREFLGRSPDGTVRRMFGSVDRSFLTTFRCTFGDCTTEDVSMVEQLYYAEGAAWLAVPLICLFSFAMIVGVFNVVSAIFVEETLQAASKVRTMKKHRRLEDQELWSARISTLTRKLLVGCGLEDIAQKDLSSNVREIHDLEIECPILDQLANDAEAFQAFVDLDIDPNDVAHLSDILDPDNGGTLFVVELIEGLRRLRGDPRRSDIVKCDLMIRAIQKTLYEMQGTMNSYIEQNNHGGEKNARRQRSSPRAEAPKKREYGVEKQSHRIRRGDTLEKVLQQEAEKEEKELQSEKDIKNRENSRESHGTASSVETHEFHQI